MGSRGLRGGSELGVEERGGLVVNCRERIEIEGERRRHCVIRR